MAAYSCDRPPGPVYGRNTAGLPADRRSVDCSGTPAAFIAPACSAPRMTSTAVDPDSPDLATTSCRSMPESITRASCAAVRSPTKTDGPPIRLPDGDVTGAAGVADMAGAGSRPMITTAVERTTARRFIATVPATCVRGVQLVGRTATSQVPHGVACQRFLRRPNVCCALRRSTRWGLET